LAPLLSFAAAGEFSRRCWAFPTALRCVAAERCLWPQPNGGRCGTRSVASVALW